MSKQFLLVNLFARFRQTDLYPQADVFIVNGVVWVHGTRFGRAGDSGMVGGYMVHGTLGAPDTTTPLRVRKYPEPRRVNIQRHPTAVPRPHFLFFRYLAENGCDHMYLAPIPK